MSKLISRRRVLRGMLNGTVVSVGLPLLNCFLNENGTALASGQNMPIRFGTWFWGLGGNDEIFVPKKTGADYDLPEEIASFAPVKKYINMYSNSLAISDTGRSGGHFAGWVINRTGSSPKSGGYIPGETIDVTIANQIGKSTRFKSLTATATGDSKVTHSYENSNTPNAPEWSPMQFYTRLFGPEFPDPNAKDFVVNPNIMVRHSVLSGVMDETRKLVKQVGAEDRQRIDQYFTGLRHLEQQFEQRLKKPEPIAVCQPASAFGGDPRMGKEEHLVAERHRLMADLIVMAIACDQTRVFNLSYSEARSSTIRPGFERPHHTTTHEEPVDQALGYQPSASWFASRSMESWAYLVEAFTKIPEGDGTLLDNVLIYGSTDVGYARTHAIDKMSMFTAGSAGGRIKTGIHVDMEDSLSTRLGYTALRVFGVDTPSWGNGSNTTSNEISEVLA